MSQTIEIQNKKSRMFQLLKDLYPLHRTINSDDMEKSLNMIGDFIGTGYKIHDYEPGTAAFTWFVPYRYYVDEAYIESEGKRYADFSQNNLSIVSYSDPVDQTISFDELKQHVYTSERQPNEIPWMFKYYKKDWGFCMKLNEWKTLKPNAKYHVVIKSRFEKKPFQVGEIVIKGKTSEEILWVSDVCHPNQVNDSISGAVVAAELAKEFNKNYNGKYTFRFLFLPETIGSIVWFSKNEDKINHIKFGIFSEMVGNNNRFLLKQTRKGNTLLDRVTAQVLSQHETHGKAEIIPFKNIVPGNDEKVMDSVGIDIPTISLTRWPYPEYHTTADNPSIIGQTNLDEAKTVFSKIIHILNKDAYPIYLSKGPIFLSRFDLWVEWRDNPELNRAIQLISFLLDGQHSVFDIAEEARIDFDTLYSYLKKFETHHLIRWSEKPVKS